MTPQLTDALTLFPRLLAAALEQPPPQAVRSRIQRRNSSNDVVFAESALWTVTVPRAKPLIPLLKGYAEHGLISASVFGIGIGWLNVEKVHGGLSGLELELSWESTITGHGNRLVSLPYPDEKTESLCQGRWTQYGVGEAKMHADCLLPDMQLIGSNVIARFPKPPVVRWRGLGKRGWFRKFTETQIESLDIDDEGADIRTGGIKNRLAPRVLWGD